MFPYYPQQSFSYYQIPINQNEYMSLLQQGFQVNSPYNTMVQVPQPFYMNCNSYQDVVKQPASLMPDASNQQSQTEPTKNFSCNCVNTDCRKEYCICFKNGEICGPKCGCSNCRNKEKHESNWATDKKKNLSCNCKKSQCAKKYCECFANGMKCGESCHCSECKNC